MAVLVLSGIFWYKDIVSVFFLKCHYCSLMDSSLLPWQQVTKSGQSDLSPHRHTVTEVLAEFGAETTG